MSVEEYYLKFLMFSRYAPSLVSNPRDEMRCFVTIVADLVRKECCTAMLYDDMTLSRLMVYAQSIEEWKLKKININLKSSGSNDQSQPRFKKKVSTKEEPRGAMVKLEKGSGSHVGKPTCATC